MKLFAAICIVVIFSVYTCTGQNGVASFYGEDSFVRPTALPGAVLHLLKKDAEVQRCISAASDFKIGTFSPKWFEATEINLNKGRETGLLVKATNDCLNGNAVSFWAFEKESGKYRTVFYTYTLNLDVHKKTTNGRYNIETGRCTASECTHRIFAFQGSRYIQKREWWTPQP